MPPTGQLFIADSLFVAVPVDSNSVERITLEEVGSVTLGDDPSVAPRTVSHLVIDTRSIALIDVGQATVYRYDRAGKTAFVLSTRNSTSTGLQAPNTLVLAGESTYVADMEQGAGIFVFDVRGNLVKRIRLRTNSASVGLVSSSAGLALATLATDQDVSARKAQFLAFLNADGTLVAQGCIPDPVYSTSVSQRRFLGLFREIGVSTDGARIYCRQPVSPTIQVFDLHGRPIQSIRFRPPFYVRASDTTATMSQPEIERFETKGMLHSAFFPTSDGFVSVYSRFDEALGRRRYQLFRARRNSAQRQVFGVAESELEPVAFLAPDTLVTVEYPSGADMRVLLHMRRLR